MSNSSLRIYCDGGARGNPGPAAAAFVIFENGKIVYKFSTYIGKTTNNVAEYSAVFKAHQWLEKNYQDRFNGVTFFLDSQLVVKQLNRQYKIKNEKLKKLFSEIKSLEEKLKVKVFYHWLDRNKNKLTDYLVNQELNKKF